MSHTHFIYTVGKKEEWQQTLIGSLLDPQTPESRFADFCRSNPDRQAELRNFWGEVVKDYIPDRDKKKLMESKKVRNLGETRRIHLERSPRKSRKRGEMPELFSV